MYTIAPLFSLASWIGSKREREKEKKKKEEGEERRSLGLVKSPVAQWPQRQPTILTVFQIPLIGFRTKAGEPPLHFNKQHPPPISQPLVLFDHKKNPSTV